MPFSQSSQISTIIGFLEQADPRSVLDVGVGMGQYGYIARMHLENNDLFVIDGADGRLKEKREWARRIDAWLAKGASDDRITVRCRLVGTRRGGG